MPMAMAIWKISILNRRTMDISSKFLHTVHRGSVQEFRRNVLLFRIEIFHALICLVRQIKAVYRSKVILASGI